METPVEIKNLMQNIADAIVASADLVDAENSEEESE